MRENKPHGLGECILKKYPTMCSQCAEFQKAAIRYYASRPAESVPAPTPTEVIAQATVNAYESVTESMFPTAPAPEAEGMEQRAQLWREQNGYVAGVCPSTANVMCAAFARAEVVRALEGAATLCEDASFDEEWKEVGRYLAAAIRQLKERV